jgi:hypothetical protein
MSVRVERIGLATLYLGDARDVLPGVKAAHIITDPPYSERTHKGHDGLKGSDGSARAALGYPALTEADAQQLAAMFHEACAGWVVWLTDHVLAPAVERALRRCGRCTFPPLPYFHAGRSVRLPGDGPSSWTDWIMVARTTALKTWGTLPGGYVAGPGWDDKARMGGKPTALMRLLVEHYSRPGDVVCDPFMGAGTTGVAAVQAGRPFIGAEIDPDAFDLACRRIAEAQSVASAAGAGIRAQRDIFVDTVA